jgi:hypothetical protein
MSNKLTNILLGAILAIGIGILIVSLQPEVSPNITVNPEVKLGSDLGLSGLDYATTAVGIVGGDVASTTAYKILSEDTSRVWSMIKVLDSNAPNEVRIWFGTTTYSDSATTTLASSTDYWGQSLPLASSTGDTYYLISEDNLWWGEVWAISTGSTSTIGTITK